MSKQQISNGGPAFPLNGHVGADGMFTELPNPGMSLRDYFAGQALVGMMANPGHERTFGPQQWALLCYDHADAMLTERNRRDAE